MEQLLELSMAFARMFSQLDVILSICVGTSVGLLLYGLKQQQQTYHHHPDPLGKGGMKGILGRMKGWFQGNF